MAKSKLKQPSARKIIRHHTVSKKHLSSYWPYIPITLIIGIGLFLGNHDPATKNGVLAYATEVNINTLLMSTNQERSSNGLPELSLNKQLTSAAQAKANDMAARDYWSHTTPEGSEPWEFIQDTGYSYQKAGENLAYGFNSSEDTISGWMNSATHRANLLDSTYEEVGFGFANAKNFNKSGPETIVVAMYGSPSGAPTGVPIGSSANETGIVNSYTPLTEEPATFGIARIQTLTKGQLPWATFAVGIIAGIIAAVTILRHGIAFKKLVAEGESFVIHHPWADVALVAIVMTGYVLTQTAGAIR